MSGRFQTSYNSTYSNPHGGDTSYQQNYLHKEMIKSRFKAMRKAFGVIEEEYNGCVSSEEVLILVSMFNLGSAKARMVAASMSKVNGRFSYTKYIRELRSKKYKYLDSVPPSLEQSLPIEVIEASKSQENLITVKGDARTRFANLNLALLAYDIDGTGLIKKELLHFMLKLFGLHEGHIRYTFGRCDHNENKKIAYVEFLDTLKSVQGSGKDLGSSIGPCPRSPFPKAK